VEKLTWLHVKALLGPPATCFVRPDGGRFNHSLFWQMMGRNAGGEPNRELYTVAQAIGKAFGDFRFQRQIRRRRWKSIPQRLGVGCFG